MALSIRPTKPLTLPVARLLAACGCVALMTGCVSPHGASTGTATANKTLDQDDSYRAAVNTFTERYEVINRFKTDNIIQVTLLHPSLVRRISKRHKELFQDEKEVFPSATDKFSYMVSLYSRDDNASDLKDKNYWNVQIESRGTAHEPVVVQELKEKSRWTPFFPHIKAWSREYLVVFDVPLVGNPGAKAALVKPATTTLKISSATGKIAIPYPY